MTGSNIFNVNGDLMIGMKFEDGVGIINTDRYGNEVKRTKQSHPYNYDPYVTWQHPESEVLEKHNGGFYTDRLLQWDFDKHDELSEKHFGDKAQLWWNDRDPKKIEAFVRDWVDDQSVTLVKLIEYCHQSSGYPVWYIGYHQESRDD